VNGMSMMGMGGAFMQKTPGANFKTIKCKYFENGGFCKN